jgi:hypothetical protein
MQADEDWRTFEFIDGLPKSEIKNRAELEKKVAARFRIKQTEAVRRVKVVLDAFHKVKERVKSARD